MTINYFGMPDMPDVDETATEILRKKYYEYQQALQELPQEQDINPKQNLEVLVTLHLEVLRNGNTSINFAWGDDSMPVADVTGQFLNRLCTGGYRKSFEDILGNFANSTVRMTPFIDRVYESWKKARNSEPLVKPRNALRANIEQ